MERETKIVRAIDKYGDLYEKGIEAGISSLRYLRKLLGKLSKESSEFDDLSKQVIIAYELREEETSPIDKLKKKIEEENHKIEVIENNRERVFNFFQTISNLLNTNPRHMKQTIAEFCEAHNLDVRNYTQTLNVCKINAIAATLWIRDFEEEFNTLKRNVRDSIFESDQRDTFLKALEKEEDTLRLKSEVIEDFRHRVRRDKDIPVSKKYTDNMDCLLGTHIKLDEERSDKGHVLTTEECSELRKEAIIIYIGESRKLFSSNMDKVVTKLDEAKQTRTTILYGIPKTKELIQ